MFEYFICNYGIQIIGLLLCAILGCLGRAAGKIYQTYVNDLTKQAVAKTVVQFVEQVWKAIHGPEKLQKALEAARVMLEKKGIDFDAEEMEILIEAAVAEFNEAFRAPIDAEDTADATRRVDEETLTAAE